MNENEKVVARILTKSRFLEGLFKTVLRMGLTTLLHTRARPNILSILLIFAIFPLQVKIFLGVKIQIFPICFLFFGAKIQISDLPDLPSFHQKSKFFYQNWNFAPVCLVNARHFTHGGQKCER